MRTKEKTEIQPAKEEMMQKVLKRFMLVGAASLFLSPVVAYSQTAEQEEETIEQVAELLDEEISAGKLTQKQAVDYVRCSQKDFETTFYKTPEGKQLSKDMQKTTVLDAEAFKKMSARERAALIDRAKKGYEAAVPFQNQAEERCMKKLGVKVPQGKIWARHLMD